MAGTVKYSRQREAIKEYIFHTKEHPTADIIYMNIKKQYPNISLGTIYRNLNFLLEQGEIIKVDCGDGCDHFDSNIEPHCHFVCTQCHKLVDLDMKSIHEINDIANEGFDGEIEGNVTYFYGICGECNQKKNI